MKFNSGTDSIVAEIDSLCDSNSTSYPIASKTRRVNIALDEVVSVILQSDGTWQFDDLNKTDLPIGTTDLVNDQQDYTFADEFLVIERVEVKDSNGNWHKLTPFDLSEETGALEELYKTNGLPIKYDKQGSSIMLYPKPATGSVTTTAGLKVWFKRNSTKFTTSDTTKEAGFASIYHPILAYMASIPYCMTYKKDRVVMYREEVRRIMENLKDFYGMREKDIPKRIKPNYHSNK